MAMSDRQRRRGIAAAQKLLPDTRVDDYVIGRGGIHPVRAGLSFVGAAVLVGILAYAVSPWVVLPGAIVVGLIQHFVSPPRGLAVTDRGVALTNRSFWHGKPSDVRDFVDLHHVYPEGRSLGRVTVGVGQSDHVWTTPDEEQRLLAAIAEVQNPGAVVAV